MNCRAQKYEAQSTPVHGNTTEQKTQYLTFVHRPDIVEHRRKVLHLGLRLYSCVPFISYLQHTTPRELN